MTRITGAVGEINIVRDMIGLYDLRNSASFCVIVDPNGDDTAVGVQVPSGAFVFLNDIDLIPTPDLHHDLTQGKFKGELQRMRSAFYDRGERETLVVPAFERLPARISSGKYPRASPWHGPCEKSEGCEVVNGMALPRSFEMLRRMVQQETVVDIFYRVMVRLPYTARVSCFTIPSCPSKCASPRTQSDEFLTGLCVRDSIHHQFSQVSSCF